MQLRSKTLTHLTYMKIKNNSNLFQNETPDLHVFTFGPDNKHISNRRVCNPVWYKESNRLLSCTVSSALHQLFLQIVGEADLKRIWEIWQHFSFSRYWSTIIFSRIKSSNGLLIIYITFLKLPHIVIQYCR